MKYEKFDLFFYILIVALLLILAAAAANGQTSSGGAYALTKTVVAGGGRDMQNAPMDVSATAGQSIAGSTSTGGQFSLYSGFWTPESFVPTAATAVVGGRIMTSSGKGVRNAKITITFPNGESQSALSGASGVYQFVNVPVGESYVFTVTAKRFRFSQATQVRQILEDTADINFIADEEILLNGVNLIP